MVEVFIDFQFTHTKRPRVEVHKTCNRIIYIDSYVVHSCPCLQVLVIIIISYQYEPRVHLHW